VREGGGVIRVTHRNSILRNPDIFAVDSIRKKTSCKPNRGPYIRPHTAMLRFNAHNESNTTRFGASVAIRVCAAAGLDGSKLGSSLPRRQEWGTTGP
jgi:hypothetical protein